MALWDGAALIFNPRVAHCISSRVCGMEDHVFCLSWYCKLGVMTGNDRTLGPREDTALFWSEALDWSEMGRQLSPGFGLEPSSERTRELVSYFGWVRDQDYAEDVKVATANESAEVQYSLWAVGGREEEKERLDNDCERCVGYGGGGK